MFLFEKEITHFRHLSSHSKLYLPETKQSNNTAAKYQVNLNYKQ